MFDFETLDKEETANNIIDSLYEKDVKDKMKELTNTVKKNSQIQETKYNIFDGVDLRGVDFSGSKGVFYVSPKELGIDNYDENIEETEEDLVDAVELNSVQELEDIYSNDSTLLEQAKTNYKIVGNKLIANVDTLSSYNNILVFASISRDRRDSIREIEFVGMNKDVIRTKNYKSHNFNLKFFFPNAKDIQIFDSIYFRDEFLDGLKYTLNVEDKDKHKNYLLLDRYSNATKIKINLSRKTCYRPCFGGYRYVNINSDLILYYEGVGNVYYSTYYNFLPEKIKFIDIKNRKAYKMPELFMKEYEPTRVIVYRDYYTLIENEFERDYSFSKAMLVGPELSALEKIMAKQEISKKLGISPKQVVFGGVETTLEEDDLPKVRKEENDTFTDKNVIESLVNQINEISSTLSDEFKDKINKILNNIIDEYKKLLASDREKYNNYIDSSNNGNVEVGSYSTAKEYLEKSLTDLLSNLKKYKEFYEVSLEINENSHLISKENILSLREKYRNGEEVELPKEMVSIKEMLTGITLYLSKMDEKITREYIDKINKILQVPREKFIELTEKNLDDELLLTLHGNPKTSIILELDSIYKEIVVMYEKNKNFYELYNTLSSNKEEKEFTKGISNEIEVIRGVISELTRNNFGIELKEKFDLLFERYKVILEDNFNKNDLSNERFKEIEKSLREELQPLLLSLNKEANRYRNGSSLIEELDRVDSVVEKNEIDIIENDSTIISYVKQMLNEIDKSTLNEKQKNSLRRQIISFKNNEKKKLDGITTKEDFIRLKTEITVEFSKMFTTLCKRIINLEKYNEHISMSEDILGVLENGVSK